MDAAPLIRFRLDPRSGVAPYRQLVDQVRQAVSLGLLRQGDQLPSVRDVVGQVTINPNTVHRAYRDLEQAGVVAGRPGVGTFVVAAASSATSPEHLRALSDELRRWMDKARHAGLDDESLSALISATINAGPDVFSAAP
ncbi:MAG: GntR family transcriptional regulator [Acidimicrobiales bacterium]